MAVYSETNGNQPTAPPQEDDFERQLKDMLRESAAVGNRSGISSVRGDISSEMTFIGRHDDGLSYAGGSQGRGTVDGLAGSGSSQRPVSFPAGFNGTVNSRPAAADHSPVASMANISLSSPDRSRDSSQRTPVSPILTLSPTQSRLNDLREWSFSTYKFTRQLVAERLGRADRTVDAELETAIADLRSTQSKYINVLNLSRALTTHFGNALASQRSLADAFGELSQKNPELHEEFTYNAETQKVLARNGDNLLRALTMFSSTLDTLCNKTITDTILTIKQFEAARIEYDAYRLDLQALMTVPRDAAVTQKLAAAQVRHDLHKDKYERLRADVTIKMKFLDENRVKVMHKQLLLFHNAVASYFSGNQLGLEETLKQFNIRMKTPNSEKLSTFLSASSP